MKQLLILVCSLLTTCAAMGQSNDSVVQQKVMEAALTEKSKQTADKRYFEYLPIRMAIGDVALVVYESSDYVVTLGVRDSSGHEGSKEDDPVAFSTLGSRVTMPFKAPASGAYFFIFTSKEPLKTGKFKVRLYYFNSVLNKVISTSPFCDKLQYIARNAYTGFEFLKYEERKGAISSYYTPTVQLLPGCDSRIIHYTGDSYQCTVGTAVNADALKQRFEDLEATVAACLPDHDKKIITNKNLFDYERKTFVRRTEYVLPGVIAGDLNTQHELSSIKDKVVIRIDKTADNMYALRLDIE